MRSKHAVASGLCVIMTTVCLKSVQLPKHLQDEFGIFWFEAAGWLVGEQNFGSLIIDRTIAMRCCSPLEVPMAYAAGAR